MIAYQENQLFIAVRPVRTREPGQSRKRLLRIIARLKARHPDPIRQMLVAARHMPLPTTKRSLTRMGRNAVEEKLELDLNARLKKMLTLERSKLEDAGILRRTEFSGCPLRVEYVLTSEGDRWVPLIDAIGDWWESTEDNIGELGSDSLDITGQEADRPSLIKS